MIPGALYNVFTYIASTAPAGESNSKQTEAVMIAAMQQLFFDKIVKALATQAQRIKDKGKKSVSFDEKSALASENNSAIGALSPTQKQQLKEIEQYLFGYVHDKDLVLQRTIPIANARSQPWTRLLYTCELAAMCTVCLRSHQKMKLDNAALQQKGGENYQTIVREIASQLFDMFVSNVSVNKNAIIDAPHELSFSSDSAEHDLEMHYWELCLPKERVEVLQSSVSIQAKLPISPATKTAAAPSDADIVKAAIGKSYSYSSITAGKRLADKEKKKSDEAPVVINPRPNESKRSTGNHQTPVSATPATNAAANVTSTANSAVPTSSRLNPSAPTFTPAA